MKAWAYTSFIFVLSCIIFLFLFVLCKGYSVVSWDFLTLEPAGTVVGEEGGIWPAIVGSFYYTLVSCFFAITLASGTAIYQVFIAKNNKTAGILQLVIQSIAGIPSIVLGLFGYTCLVLYSSLGKSILAGGITAGIMILPFMEVQIEKILNEVDPELIKASSALGVGRFYMLKHLIWPEVKEQIIFTILLGSCYAVGAAAPLMFTGAVLLSPVPSSLLEPAMSLPNHLYNLLSQGISVETAYGTALVLLVLVLLTNLLPLLYFFWKKELLKS